MSAAHTGCASTVSGNPRGFGTLGNGLLNKWHAKSTVSLCGTGVEIMRGEGKVEGLAAHTMVKVM